MPKTEPDDPSISKTNDVQGAATWGGMTASDAQPALTITDGSLIGRRNRL